MALLILLISFSALFIKDAQPSQIFTSPQSPNDFDRRVARLEWLSTFQIGLISAIGGIFLLTVVILIIVVFHKKCPCYKLQHPSKTDADPEYAHQLSQVVPTIEKKTSSFKLSTNRFESYETESSKLCQAVPTIERKTASSELSNNRVESSETKSKSNHPKVFLKGGEGFPWELLDQDCFDHILKWIGNDLKAILALSSVNKKLKSLMGEKWRGMSELHITLCSTRSVSAINSVPVKWPQYKPDHPMHTGYCDGSPNDDIRDEVDKKTLDAISEIAGQAYNIFSLGLSQQPRYKETCANYSLLGVVLDAIKKSKKPRYNMKKLGIGCRVQHVTEKQMALIPKLFPGLITLDTHIISTPNLEWIVEDRMKLTMAIIESYSKEHCKDKEPARLEILERYPHRTKPPLYTAKQWWGSYGPFNGLPLYSNSDDDSEADYLNPPRPMVLCRTITKNFKYDKVEYVNDKPWRHMDSARWTEYKKGSSTVEYHWYMGETH